VKGGDFVKRYNLWIGIGIFAIIVTTLLIYQQHRKQEFVHYLQQVEACFLEIDSLQELSLKANQAAMSGDHVREMELTQTMIERSEAFLEPFQTISVPSGALMKMHAKLLELNDGTHQLLVFRSESIRQLQDVSISAEEKQQRVEEFWKRQEDNKTLFRMLSEELHKYGKRVGVDPAIYLKHFL
jgi:hypothetical protein